MAGISQIIRWRQGRAVVSRSAQKAKGGGAASPAHAQAQTAPPSTKVTLGGSQPAGPLTYLEKVKRKAKADAKFNAARVQALQRQTQATNGSVPAAGGAGMQQALREALSAFAVLSEPVVRTPATEPPRGPTPPTLPPQTADVSVSWDPDPAYELSAQAQQAQAQREEDADADAARADADETPPTPAST